MLEINITLSNFREKVMDAPEVVLLDFWAPWCGPCQMMGEVLEQVANDYAGRVKVGKVNVDEELDLATAFAIEGLPTLLVFRNGKMTGSAMGFQVRENVDRLIAEAEAQGNATHKKYRK